MKRENSVVITGVGAITALGLSADETWNSLLAGRQGVRRLEGFEVGGFACQVGAQVRGLGPEVLGSDAKLARVMDLHSFMLFKCSEDAFVQAGLKGSGIAPEDIGFFVGMGMVNQKLEDLLPAVLASMDATGALDLDAYYSRGYRQIYPLITLSMLNNVSFCEVAIRLKIRGENAVFSPHADSGAQAIAEGVRTLQEQRARVVLVGGVSEKIDPPGLARAHLQEVLNVTDSDFHPCRPFAVDRKGTVLGEGCGVVSLELRRTADERGVPYAAMVSGYGCAFESESGFPAPTTRAIVRAMEQALASAEIGAADVDVVIPHADGTFKGDENEIDAIEQVFATCRGRLRVFWSKGAVGHLLAGAFPVDVIVGTYMVRQGLIPPTLASTSMDDRIGSYTLRVEPFRRQPRRLLLNCQSWEGQCASLVIEAVPERE